MDDIVEESSMIKARNALFGLSLSSQASEAVSAVSK
jgi:hypothetical protein